MRKKCTTCGLRTGGGSVGCQCGGFTAEPAQLRALYAAAYSRYSCMNGPLAFAAAERYRRLLLSLTPEPLSVQRSLFE